VDPAADPAKAAAAVAAAKSAAVNSEVKLGVEAVRQWEEKVAHNLTALQRRTEAALDALRAAQAASADLEAKLHSQAKKLHKANNNNNNDNINDDNNNSNNNGTDAAAVVSGLGDLVGALGSRQNTLRAALVKQVGPASCCPPRHRMLFNLRNEVLRCLG